MTGRDAPRSRPAPRVTIVIPTFQRADRLPETLDSLLSQTDDGFELIVVDDGSTDGTAEVLAGYTERFGDRLRVIRQSNGGEGSAVNRGWQLASGEYVCIVNSDDPQPAVFVERSVAFMDAHPETLVGYPDWAEIDGHGNVVREHRVDEFSLEGMIGNLQCLPGPGAFIRRSAVGPHLPRLRDPQYVLVSDFATWLDLAALGPFMRNPETLACWRRHEGATSVTLSQVARHTERLLLVDTYFARADLPADVRRWEPDARRNALVYLTLAMRHGPWGETDATRRLIASLVLMRPRSIVESAVRRALRLRARSLEGRD